MSAQSYPTAEFVRQCFREEGGRLFWLARPREHFKSDSGFKSWNAKYPGKEAGCPRKDKDNIRWRVSVDNGQHPRSTIVWLMRTGDWCKEFLDHISRNTQDDRFENLRPATRAQNQANTRAHVDSESGFKGVKLNKPTNKWRASIHVNGKSVHLGLFDTPEEAHAVYVDAAKKHFGEFACAG